MIDPMVTAVPSCKELAAVLVQDHHAGASLPDVLPCGALELLVELHQIVLEAQLRDLPHAQRAAEVASYVAARYPHEPLVQAQLCWTRGNAILYQPAYARALALYDEALAWFDQAWKEDASVIAVRDVRAVHLTRIFCLSELGRYAEALRAVELAEAWLEERPFDLGRLILLLNRSQLAERQGRYAEVVELADATITLASQPAYLNQRSYTTRRAQAWVNRGYACTNLGRFEEAIQAFSQAIAIAREANDTLTIGRALWNRARVLAYQGELFEALTTLRNAVPLLDQAAGERATIALLEAELQERLRQLHDAQRAARFAAASFIEQGMTSYSTSATLRAIRLSVEQGQPNEAQTLLRSLSNHHPAQQSPILQAEIRLAEAAVMTLAIQKSRSAAYQRRCRAVLQLAGDAVETLRTAGLSHEAAVGELTIAALNVQLGNVPAAQALYTRLTQHTSLPIRVAAHSAIGATLPAAEAVSHFQLAVVHTIEQRRALPMEELQARYSSETSQHHMRLAACYVKLQQNQAALEQICEAKAGPLLDLRAASATLDTAEVDHIDTYRSAIARHRQQMRDQRLAADYATEQGHHAAAAHYLQESQAAALQLEATEQSLLAVFRSLGPRVGAAKVANTTDIQKALHPGAALLEYARFDDQLVCFMVRPDQDVQWQMLGEYRRLAVLLDRWALVCQRLMSVSGAADTTSQMPQVLQPLWDILLAPWQDTLAAAADVVIAPYGILHNIPWAALFDCGSHSTTRPTLTLTPSAGIWATQITPPAEAMGSPRLLGYAGTDDLFLEHVQEELSMIARHQATASINTQATTNDLRRQPNPRILHIAAHAGTDTRTPLRSTIELADGPFRLLEAHRLQLHGTELVSLSGCETGVCPDQGGVTLALAGAFLCAGAQSVLASLWRVSDEAASELMAHFYTALQHGESMPAALQSAQTQLYEAHPLDWAAFQLWVGAQRAYGLCS